MKTIWTLTVAALVTACTTQVTTSEEPESVALPEQEQVAAAPATTTAAAAPPASTSYALPAWSLEDVQPKSARYKERYGLEAYSGKTIVVILLEGYCPYCQSNSIVAERLQDELMAEKLDVRVVVLADLNGAQFAKKVSLPIFRDDDGAAWEAMRAGASKHDTFVFGPDGKRTFFWLGSYQGDASRWSAEVGAAARAVAKPLPPGG